MCCRRPCLFRTLKSQGLKPGMKQTLVLLAVTVTCAALQNGILPQPSRVTQRSALYCQGRSDLCSLRYDQITLPGTHNSGSGFKGPLFYPSGAPAIPCFLQNQDLNYTGQLDFGIRFFDFDLCWVSDEAATVAVPAGLWTCHSNAYAGKLEMALTQINDWMNLHPDQIVSLYFNGDYDHSKSQPIAQELHTLLENMWEPTQERISNGSLAMNTDLNTTGEWPTLYNAIYTSRARIFVFVHETLQMGGKPWIHSPIPDTFPSQDVIDNCNGIIGTTEGHCDVCEDLLSVEVVASRGHCLFELAELCNVVVDNATEACYALRRQYGKTVNVIEVDFPNRSPEGMSVVQVADKLNDRNVEYFGGSSPQPTPLPTPTDCFPGYTPTPTPSPEPQPSTYCEALQQMSERPFLYFLCEPNEECDHLICPVDFTDSGGTLLFQVEYTILECTYPFEFQNIIKDPIGRIIGQIQTNQSGIFRILNFPLNVTLEQLGSSVGLSIIVVTEDGRPGDVDYLIEHIVIPLDTTSCIDYDECEFGLDNCHEDATCSGNDLGFTCTCNPGYTGDGVTCAPITEPPPVSPIEISLTASGRNVEVQLSATTVSKIRVILRNANHGRETQLFTGDSGSVIFTNLPVGTTFVRAVGKSPNGGRFSTNWMEIKVD